MPKLTYHSLQASPADAWLALLNSTTVRRHLLPHPPFTAESVNDWLTSKSRADQVPGCRVRAILSGTELVGWCAIQQESGSYELAIVLSPKYWGHGRMVMNEVLGWARELGHTHLFVHLPTTRQKTRAISKLLGDPVAATVIHDHAFNTYRIEV